MERLLQNAVVLLGMLAISCDCSPHVRDLHSKADSNGDGKLSHDEMVFILTESRTAKASRRIRELVDSVDKNGDEALSYDELHQHTFVDAQDHEVPEAVFKDKFKAADKNNDSILSTAELFNFYYPENSVPVLDVVVKAEIAKRDADNDGKLSPEEFVPGPDADVHDFVKIDSNKDGYISVDELKTWESAFGKLQHAVFSIIKRADQDDDKHLTEEELVQSWNGLRDDRGADFILNWHDISEL